MARLPNAAPLTEAQYLELERSAEIKSEFHDGQMFAMAGGSPNHSLLGNRIGALLDREIPEGCRAFNSELRIRAASAGIYTYPDCSVICGDLEYSGEQKDVVTNPLLIVEVLSPSTEAYDRGRKFEMYRTIPSFREYLLIHQDRRHVEHYSKQDDGGWILREYSGVDAMLAIPRLNAQISLGELYATALDLD
jgi:Uma2 family endonuclease